MILALLVAALAAPAACQPVDTDRIYTRDLAAALPAFASVSPDIAVGFAPAPGQQRLFRPAELRHIAQMNHVAAAGIAGSVCFAWRMTPPSRDAVFAAMRETLQGRNARLEIVSQSASPAPSGKLVFPLSGLCGFSADPVIWRGYVLYGLNHRFSIWARARVSVKESRLIATGTLAAGEPVRADELREDSYDGPLSRQNPVTAWDIAVGMIPRFDIPAGTVLMRNMLDQPKEVERGDLVAVIVQTGGTHIEAQGVAEQSGRTGAVITVRNAKSGWKFRARVEDKDKVLVVPGGPIGLVNEESKS